MLGAFWQISTPLFAWFTKRVRWPIVFNRQSGDALAAQVLSRQASDMVAAQELGRISDVYAAYSRMRPVRVWKSGTQPLASKERIFELQCWDIEHYYLLPTDPGSIGCPVLDGVFNFVILANAPGRVLCGVPQFSFGADQNFGTYGHTSLSARQDVLFAGTMFFDQGALCHWTNDSGHYRPLASDRLINLIPAVQRVLPRYAFVDPKNPPQTWIDAIYGH